MTDSNSPVQAASELAENAAQKIIDALPKNMLKTWHGATAELNTLVRAGVQDALLKMDILTRDEFDAQQRVLERLNKKVAELEAIIQQLEESQ